MPDPNAQIQALLEELVANSDEIGLQAAAYLDGRLVIDAWAGTVDRGSVQPVNGETLFMLSSCSKGVTATCLHILADRGQLDYDQPISVYWPEFGAEGKSGATVRDALCHRTGIPQTPPGYTPDWMCDWERMCTSLARLTPMFEPGVRTAYHSLNFGYVLGEVVRRVDGRPIAQFLQDEVCVPLGLDLFLGVPTHLVPRVAILVDGPAPPEQWAARLVGEPTTGGLASVFNRPEVQQASIPATGAIGSARALARHYAMLAEGGELDGVRVLSRKRVEFLMHALQSYELDEIYRVRIRRGLGYRLGEDAGPAAGRHALGHVGGGGAFGYAEPERRFAVALVKNYLRDALGSPGGTTPDAVSAATRGVRDFKGGAYTEISAAVAYHIRKVLGI